MEEAEKKVPYSFLILIFSIIGAFVYWYPTIYGFNFYPGDSEEFFNNLTPLWIYFSYFCLIIAIPLNTLALIRKDFFGFLGMLFVVSVIVGLRFVYMVA